MNRPMQSIVSAFIGGYPPPRIHGVKLTAQERAKRERIRLAWLTSLRYARGLTLKASLNLDWHAIMRREDLLAKLRKQYMRGLQELIQESSEWATVVGLCGRGYGMRKKARIKRRISERFTEDGDPM